MNYPSRHTSAKCSSEALALNRGLTIVELLVVIAIIGLLAAILFPILGRVREKGRQSVCMSNLRQIMAGTLLYSQEHNGYLPLVVGPESWGDDRRWATQLQPYFNSELAAVSIDPLSILKCPSDGVVRTSAAADESTWCSYGLNIRVHPTGNINKTNQKRYTLIPNPNQTILFGDVWYFANTVSQSHSLLSFMGDFHASATGSNYAFADGHVEFMTKSKATVLDANTGRELYLYIPD